MSIFLFLDFERDDSTRMTGDCSASCGIGVFPQKRLGSCIFTRLFSFLGVRQVLFQYRRFFDGAMTVIDASELPLGVIKATVEFCGADLRIW